MPMATENYYQVSILVNEMLLSVCLQSLLTQIVCRILFQTSVIFLDFCLKTYKKLPGTELHKYAMKDLKHSLASLILEMNKDAARMEQEVGE